MIEAYASIIANQPKSNYRFIGDGRETKKRVQEHTRGNFYWLYQQIRAKNDKEDILRLTGAYRDRLDNVDPNLALVYFTGIEKKVFSLYQENPSSLEKVAQAFMEGSEEFHRQYFSKGQDKRFLEYNRILASLTKMK